MPIGREKSRDDAVASSFELLSEEVLSSANRSGSLLDVVEIGAHLY